MIRQGLLLAALLAGCASTDAPLKADRSTDATPAVNTGQGMLAPVQEASASPHKRSVKELSAPAVGYYRIQDGDTLYTIAFLRQLDVNDLADWNRISDPTHILAGELLRVTAPTGVSSSPPPMLKRSPADSPVKPLEVPSAAAVDDLAPEGWSWPCRGELLARFGEASSKGIEIDGKLRQPIYAAAKGMVVYAGTGLRGYGKLIIIRHGKNLLSAYAHNAKILAYEGQSVRRGQQVAEMGNTDADRVKLHFEIRERGKPVDPMNYLPKAS